MLNHYNTHSLFQNDLEPRQQVIAPLHPLTLPNEPPKSPICHAHLLIQTLPRVPNQNLLLLNPLCSLILPSLSVVGLHRETL